VIKAIFNFLKFYNKNYWRRLRVLKMDLNNRMIVNLNDDKIVYSSDAILINDWGWLVNGVQPINPYLDAL